VQDFVLSDRVLPVIVRVHPQAKRLILRIENGGKALRVTVPPATTERQIAAFLQTCHSWVESKLIKLPPPHNIQNQGSMLRDGVKIPYLGQPHRIVHQGGRGVTCLITRQGECQIIVTGEAAHLPRRLMAFFKQQARITIAPLVAAYAAQIGCQPTSIHYKDTRSRWGSCSAAGRLSFSWRIMMAPPPVIRYLVAHEVAHLAEMNHGRRFWQICTQLCPQTQHCRAWLKRNGQSLHAIDFT